LEYASRDDAGAQYDVSIYEPGEVVHTTSAHLGAQGVTLQAWPSDPPAWARTFTDRLLQTTAKKHASGTWPRKITRWREPR